MVILSSPQELATSERHAAQILTAALTPADALTSLGFRLIWMQWFRAHRARIAAVTMVWMAIVGASAVVPHEDDSHDTYAFAVAHDHSAHRVEAAGSDAGGHPLHCLVCHWVRSFRPPTDVRTASLPATDTGISLPLERFSISAAAPVSQPPLRSPPSHS